MKLRIHAIDKQKNHVIAKTTEIYSVTNTTKKLHIQSDLHLVYKQNFYHDKEKEMYELFDEYHIPLLKDIDHPELIQQWRRNLDAAAYEKDLNKGIKIPPKKK